MFFATNYINSNQGTRYFEVITWSNTSYFSYLIEKDVKII